MHSDPLQHLFSLNKPDPASVNRIVSGSLCMAIVLNNNQIGVCATLNAKFDADLSVLSAPDFNKPSHRAILIAYYNAFYNSKIAFDDTADIMEAVAFDTINNIVMIGNFRPIVKRFDEKGIPISVFDLENDCDYLTDIKLQKDYLNKADAVIVTGTTLVNNTFTDILNNTNDACKVYLLGPSNIMTAEMLKYRNVKMVFGSVFIDTANVINLVEHGGSIRECLKYAKKCAISLSSI